MTGMNVVVMQAQNIVKQDHKEQHKRRSYQTKTSMHCYKKIVHCTLYIPGARWCVCLYSMGYQLLHLWSWCRSVFYVGYSTGGMNIA